MSCPACISEFTDADRARFAERQRQMELAARRGRAHLGPQARGRATDQAGTAAGVRDSSGRSRTGRCTSAENAPTPTPIHHTKS